MLPHQRVVHVVVEHELDTASEFLGSTTRGAASASYVRYPVASSGLAGDRTGGGGGGGGGPGVGWRNGRRNYRKKKRAGPG